MRMMFFGFFEAFPVPFVRLGDVLVAEADDPEVVPLGEIGEVPETESTPPQSTFVDPAV